MVRVLARVEHSPTDSLPEFDLTQRVLRSAAVDQSGIT